MPKLTFRGTSIRYVDVRYDERSKTTYTKIYLTAAWTEPIREAMEWGQPPEGFASAKLDGELVATMLELIPNGELKMHSFDLETKEIAGFELHRVKSEDGESTENELRFQIVTTAAKAAQKLAAYLGVIGKGEAQLKVTYEAQSVLETEAADAQERLVSEEQAADTAASSDEPTLPSVGKRHGARKKADQVN